MSRRLQPVIERVEVVTGEVLYPTQDLHFGEITLVQSITVNAYTSDGKTISSPLNVAVDLKPLDDVKQAQSFHVYLTPRGGHENERDSSLFMAMLGGLIDCDDESDDLIVERFEENLDQYFVTIGGPTPMMAARIFWEACNLSDDWSEVSMRSGGVLSVQYKDGRTVEVAV